MKCKSDANYIANMFIFLLRENICTIRIMLSVVKSVYYLVYKFSHKLLKKSALKLLVFALKRGSSKLTILEFECNSWKLPLGSVRGFGFSSNFMLLLFSSSHSDFIQNFV